VSVDFKWVSGNFMYESNLISNLWAWVVSSRVTQMYVSMLQRVQKKIVGN